MYIATRNQQVLNHRHIYYLAHIYTGHHPIFYCEWMTTHSGCQVCLTPPHLTSYLNHKVIIIILPVHHSSWSFIWHKTYSCNLSLWIFMRGYTTQSMDVDIMNIHEFDLTWPQLLSINDDQLSCGSVQCADQLMIWPYLLFTWYMFRSESVAHIWHVIHPHTFDFKSRSPFMLPFILGIFIHVLINVHISPLNVILFWKYWRRHEFYLQEFRGK